MLVKSIEEKIKINKVVSISAILASVVITMAGLFYAFKLVEDSRKSIYIIDNGVPILVKQTDELLNRPVEYKAQVELFHKLFFTIPPDDKYIKENVEQALYLIDESGKKEYINLKEKGFYNQLISSNSIMTLNTDSIQVDIPNKKFRYFGTQFINRKTSLITRRLITEGSFDDVIRSQNNPHGVMLHHWRILDNTDIKTEMK